MFGKKHDTPAGHAPPTAQPAACGTCRMYASRPDKPHYGECKLNPVPTPKLATDWCGQYARKEP